MGVNRGRLLGCIRIGSVVALASMLGQVTVVVAAPPPVVVALPDVNPTRYLVTFRTALATTASTIGRRPLVDPLQVIHRYRSVFNGLAVFATADQAAALRQSPTVASVVADVVMHADDTQTSPTPPWGIDRLDQLSASADGSYTYPNNGAGVTVYVVDSGVYPHPDFNGRVAAGITYINDGNGTSDCSSSGSGHGTHVAGIIGSTTYGVAKGVTIVPVRGLDCDNSGWSTDLIAGFDWAIADHTSGAAVINASFGGDYFPPWDAAVDRAVADGIVVSIAAGNDGPSASSCTSSPASAPNGVTVGSTDLGDSVSSFSTLGSCVDIFAPGRGILSLKQVGSLTTTKSGTSMAAPHVAGVAALMMAAIPSLTPSEVAQNLRSTSLAGAVGGSLGSAPNYLLHLPASISRPVHDAHAAATPLDIWESSVTGTTLFATKQAGEPMVAGVSGSGSVWWRFVSPVSGTLSLSTQGSSFDTMLGLYVGASVGSLSQVAANDQAGGVNAWSAISATINAGTTYWVAVDGKGQQRGSVTLASTFSPGAPAPNDAFANAGVLGSTLATTTDTHTRGASRESGEPIHAGASGGAASLWWTTTPAVDGRLFVSTAGSSFNTVLGLYNGTDVAALVTVASNDQTAGAQTGGDESQVFVPVTGGVPYRVGIDGTSNDQAIGTGALQLRTALIADGSGFYAPLAAPIRLFDTRAGRLGILEQVDESGAFGAGQIRRYVVSAVDGLGSASTLALNISAVTPTFSGYLSVYPCESTASPIPSTSSLNFLGGETRANSALVGLASGGFCVLSSNVTHVVVDVSGSYEAGAGFTNLPAPVRVFDTRAGRTGISEPIDQTTALSAGEVRRYVLPNASGLPSQMSAVAFNIVGIAPSATGFLKAWACDSAGTPQPFTSTLNYRTNITVANAGVLGVASNSGICVTSSQPSHVLLDITGWFAINGSTVSGARPERFVDTRAGQLGAIERFADIGQPLVGGQVYLYDTSMQAGLPGNAVANSVLVNVVAVAPTAGGYLTMWPCSSTSTPAPPTAILNYVSGTTAGNGAIVAVANGKLCVFSTQTVDVVIDITGWQATAF